MKNQPAFNHQEFSIEAEARKKVIRQERFFISNASHKLKINDKYYEIDNYSSFGVGLKNANDLSNSIELFKAQYLINDIVICDINVRQTRKDDMGYFAFSVEGQTLPIDAIQAIEKSSHVIENFEKSISQFIDVPQAFKDRTFEVKAWMEALEGEINKLTKSSFDTTLRELKQHEEAVAFYVSQYLFKKMPAFAEAMGVALAGVSQGKVKHCYEFLRAQLGEVFYKSAYGNRAFAKPRGYAGDFEMMNNVYHNDLRGDTLFGKCMQRYFTDNPAGRAVRNRAQYLNNKISEAVKANETAKILAVASGPAREIQKLFLEQPELASKCEIHLLDQDVEALTLSQREIFEICRTKGINKPNIHFHNLAIKNVINEGLPVHDFDLIYSAGLFDYFTDPVAQFAASRLFSSLKPAGKLVIGNFSTNNPAQFIMEAIGDWYLIYRDESVLRKLFSKISPNLEIESEKEGVNLFAVMTK